LKKIYLGDFGKQKELSFWSAPKNYYLIKSLAVHLAINNKLKQSQEVLESFPEDYYRRNYTIDIVYALQENGPVENSFI